MFHNIVHFIVLRPASVTQSAKKKTSSEINAAGNHEPGRGHCQPGPNSARAGPGPQCANAAACKPDSHGLQARARMGAHSLNGPGRPDCGIPKQSKSRISTHEIIIIIDNLLAPFLLENNILGFSETHYCSKSSTIKLKHTPSYHHLLGLEYSNVPVILRRLLGLHLK